MKQEQQLDRYAELLRDAPHNLVGARDRADVRLRHVEECWQVGRLLPCQAGQRWLDLGTGGGLPGLVLAIQHPEVRWTLIDATRKKIAAVRRFIAVLGLDNVHAEPGRAEQLAYQPVHRAAYDGLVSRAVAPLPVLLSWSRPFVRPGGVLAAIKGPAVERELIEVAPCLGPLALRPLSTDVVPGTIRPTWLVTMRAHGPPPTSLPAP